MTDQEIKKLCEEEQKRQGGKNYPNYDFKIEQTNAKIKIYWEYLDGACWTINKGMLMVINEHGEIMNKYFEYDNTVEELIKSSISYMVTRY